MGPEFRAHWRLGKSWFSVSLVLLQYSVGSMKSLFLIWFYIIKTWLETHGVSNRHRILQRGQLVKSIRPDIPWFPWSFNIFLISLGFILFLSIDLGLDNIVCLPTSFNLNLNSSPSRPYHEKIEVCDFRKMLFHCLSFFNEGIRLFNSFSSSD